jgi:DNA-binding MarR family transcriptional regulator
MSKKPTKSSTKAGSVPNPPAAFDLEGHIFYLFGRALVARNRSLEPLLSKLDLSVNNWRVLATLSSKPALSTVRLSELTLIDRTTLTRTIDRMCERGLVSRSEDQFDKRIKLVSLDRKGQAALLEVLPVAAAHLDLATEGLSGPQQRLFRKMLLTVIANLERD